MNEQTTIFSEQECSKHTGLSRAILWRLRTAGRISHYKVGTRILYDEKHIEECLQGQERRAKTSRKTNSVGGDPT